MIRPPAFPAGTPPATPTTTPTVTSVAPRPAKPPAGPTINIVETNSAPPNNLPLSEDGAACHWRAADLVAIAYVIKRPQPQGSGSLDNVVPAEIQGQGSTMVALTFTLRNTSMKIFYVHEIQAKLKTVDTESTSEAVSAVNFLATFGASPPSRMVPSPHLSQKPSCSPAKK